MKLVYSFVLLTCAFWEIDGYPYNPYYGARTDSLTFGAGDSSRGGMVLSRYYNPYYNTVPMGGGLAAFMVREPEVQAQPRPSQYYLPDKRRQVSETSYLPPQQNEVIPSFQGDLMQQPEKPFSNAADVADPTEKVEILSTTLKSLVPELIEPEIDLVDEPEDEPVQKSKKRVTKKKQTTKPIDDDEEEETPKIPSGAFFPMFFGWGGRSGGAPGGAPGGAIAVANAYSTARGGVASSHATAYGEPRPDFPRSNLRQKNN